MISTDSNAARLDHLVFGTASLAGGADAFARRTGVRLPPGGRHPLMGTHNRLTRVAEGSFVELIAIDPEAAPPGRSRWFSLDDTTTAARLAEGPALLAWVVGVDDLDAALGAALDAGVEAGRAVMQRRGELSWRISVRDDGALVEGGAFPALIEWPDGAGAAARMTDVGLRVLALEITHPDPARLAVALEAIGAGALAGLAEGEPGIGAVLRTADGAETRWGSIGEGVERSPSAPASGKVRR